MNAALYIHRADVIRQVGSVQSGSRQESWQTVISDMPCRVEPLTGRDRESILGRIGSLVYRMTWATEDVRDGDRVQTLGRIFVTREILDDTGRHTLRYRTCLLVEAKR
jgi:hypothetical protein